ncbi:hypothetical protein BY996DRAFT_1911301 [Phakopsora pachyrhizi]|nr:hypothetical protein BY996DRAFT_1911301 [Phakopsora pachyrhizi]
MTDLSETNQLERGTLSSSGLTQSDEKKNYFQRHCQFLIPIEPILGIEAQTFVLKNQISSKPFSINQRFREDGYCTFVDPQSLDDLMISLMFACPGDSDSQGVLLLEDVKVLIQPAVGSLGFSSSKSDDDLYVVLEPLTASTIKFPIWICDQTKLDLVYSVNLKSRALTLRGSQPFDELMPSQSYYSSSIPIMDLNNAFQYQKSGIAISETTKDSDWTNYWAESNSTTQQPTISSKGSRQKWLGNPKELSSQDRWFEESGRYSSNSPDSNTSCSKSDLENGPIYILKVVVKARRVAESPGRESPEYLTDSIENIWASVLSNRSMRSSNTLEMLPMDRVRDLLNRATQKDSVGSISNMKELSHDRISHLTAGSKRHSASNLVRAMTAFNLALGTHLLRLLGTF